MQILIHKIVLFYLDILQHRDISNEIANRFHVLHQSPQIILFKNSELVYHASHYAIDPIAIDRLLQKDS